MDTNPNATDSKVLGAAISYIIAAIFVGVGFHKLFIYENSEIFVYEHKNSYVGGDAYNYIINANYATAYFTLAILFALIGATFLIVFYLTKPEKKEEPSTKPDTKIDELKTIDA